MCGFVNEEETETTDHNDTMKSCVGSGPGDTNRHSRKADDPGRVAMPGPCHMERTPAYAINRLCMGTLLCHCWISNVTEIPSLK